MSLRDRIAEIVASGHGSGDIADAILADPEIAALREVAEAVIEEVAAESSFEPTAGHRDRRGVARRIATAKSRKYAALARLEEARRG